MNKYHKGFTLVELLVVISIISMLSSIVMASINSARDKARIAAGQAFDAQIFRANGAEGVLVWDFDEGAGASVTNTGTLTTGQFDGVLTSQTWTSGMTRGALTFNGSGIVVNMPDLRDRADLFGGIASGKLMFSAWIRRGSDSGPQRYIIMGLPGVVSIRVNTSVNRISYELMTSPSGSSGAAAPTIVKQNEWTHIALVTEAGVNAKIYINGKLDQTTNFAPTLDTPNSGSVATIVGFNFIGSMDNVRVYYYSL